MYDCRRGFPWKLEAFTNASMKQWWLCNAEDLTLCVDFSFTVTELKCSR